MLDGDTDGAGNILNELSDGQSMKISSDGKCAYLTAEDAITTFSRNSITGRLTLVTTKK